MTQQYLNNNVKEMDSEGRWRKVEHKKRKSKPRWDSERNKRIDRSSVKRETTTLFITEFDEMWSARDLYMEFKKLGVIDEVVIPLRKDSREIRYGFVRFPGEEDDRLLATRLDNLFLEGRKLHANIPRFRRSVQVMVKEKNMMK